MYINAGKYVYCLTVCISKSFTDVFRLLYPMDFYGLLACELQYFSNINRATATTKKHQINMKFYLLAFLAAILLACAAAAAQGPPPPPPHKNVTAGAAFAPRDHIVKRNFAATPPPPPPPKKVTA